LDVVIPTLEVGFCQTSWVALVSNIAITEELAAPNVLHVTRAPCLDI
jgi:hypothetical protein